GVDIAKELAAQARRLNCATLAVGRPEPATGWACWRFSPELTHELARLAPGLDIVEVARAESSRRLAQVRPGARRDDLEVEDADRPRARWPGYAWATASSIAITLLALPLVGVLELANIVMLFLLGVVGVAMRFGRGPAAFAASLNVAAFDFF